MMLKDKRAILKKELQFSNREKKLVLPLDRLAGLV